jgi:hypothetical protein
MWFYQNGKLRTETMTEFGVIINFRDKMIAIDEVICQ